MNDKLHTIPTFILPCLFSTPRYHFCRLLVLPEVIMGRGRRGYAAKCHGSRRPADQNSAENSCGVMSCREEILK